MLGRQHVSRLKGDMVARGGANEKLGGALLAMGMGMAVTREFGVGVYELLSERVMDGLSQESC